MTTPTSGRTIAVEEMIAAAEREFRMRHAVYPGRVAAGKMSQAKADHEIAAMAMILATLRSLPDLERRARANGMRDAADIANSWFRGEYPTGTPLTAAILTAATEVETSHG